MAKRKSVEQLLKLNAGQVLKLDIGCGENKQAEDGWIGMDVRDLAGVDVVHNIEKTPWPFKKETFTLLSASHVMEHINPVNFGFIKVMDEAWRVLKFGGQFRIATPYAGSTMWWSDPTHLIGLTPQTFAHFDPMHPLKTYPQYRPKPWKIEQCFWSPEGNMEILLSKRHEDPSYKKITLS